MQQILNYWDVSQKNDKYGVEEMNIIDLMCLLHPRDAEYAEYIATSLCRHCHDPNH